jgi:hypothetical protein
MMPLADWSQREHDHQHIHPGCYQEYRSPIASRVIQTIGEPHQKGGMPLAVSSSVAFAVAY